MRRGSPTRIRSISCIGFIHLALPNARFIHCRRDPIDTCLSIYFTHFAAPQSFAYDRGDLVFYYRQYERLMAHWRRVIPADRLLEIDYEALTADPEQHSRRLIAFAGLDWDDACLTPERNQRVVRTASIWQARQPVYRSSVARWRTMNLGWANWRNSALEPTDATSVAGSARLDVAVIWSAGARRCRPITRGPPRTWR